MLVRLILLLVFVVCILSSSKASEKSPTEKDSPFSGDKDKQANNRTTTEPIPLAESIKTLQQSFRDPEVQKIRRDYWKKTFDEIKNLASGRGRNTSSFGQWKLLLDDEPAPNGDIGQNATRTTTSKTRKRTPRFEGFPSWDRLLQEWADEVQDYLERAEQESSEGYSLGNFGRPANVGDPAKPKSSSVDDRNETAEAVDTSSLSGESGVSSAANVADEPVAKKEPTVARKVSLPVPAPRKQGEPVLAHTDISDKSKRLLIVTTASLPWKTGTAVNPLLRAAFLTKGRKEAGGSVTLMLPWLERPVDQARVYGENNTFESPEEQEEYIRTWLRDAANLQQPSQDLIIRWYTAWQNPVENSIYSMGDITALIPSESVDVCILEEPEHLNW